MNNKLAKVGFYGIILNNREIQSNIIATYNLKMNKDKDKKINKKGKSKDTFRQELTEKQKKDIK